MLDKVLDYWEKMAGWVLPFLVERRVAIEQKFGDFTTYHRHPKDSKNRWIYIKAEDEVVRWADKHAWSFHPHILGKNNWWFVIDVDGRGESFDIDLIKDIAVKLGKIFYEAGLNYLVKYSGNRGFHFMWEWDMSEVSLSGKDRWEEAKKLVVNYRDHLETALGEDKKLDARLKKVVHSGCPYTLTNSQEKECKNAVLLDANILHDNANIRSPYSVHLKTGLVSVPLEGTEGLRRFTKKDAERSVVVKKDWSWVEMPINKWPK